MYNLFLKTCCTPLLNFYEDRLIELKFIEGKEITKQNKEREIERSSEAQALNTVSTQQIQDMSTEIAESTKPQENNPHFWDRPDNTEQNEETLVPSESANTSYNTRRQQFHLFAISEFFVSVFILCNPLKS